MTRRRKETGEEETLPETTDRDRRAANPCEGEIVGSSASLFFDLVLSDLNRVETVELE